MTDRTPRTWTGSPTKINGEWGVKIDTYQGGEGTYHLEPCGTGGWTEYDHEPCKGDKVKITTRGGKSWWTTIESNQGISRNRYRGESWWTCTTPQRGGKKKSSTPKAPRPVQQTKAERTAAQQARYEAHKDDRTADGRVPHYVTAMFMAIGASEEECEEIDRWKDAAKEGYLY
jgi:hypothetical protein